MAAFRELLGTLDPTGRLGLVTQLESSKNPLLVKYVNHILGLSLASSSSSSRVGQLDVRQTDLKVLCS